MGCRGKQEIVCSVDQGGHGYGEQQAEELQEAVASQLPVLGSGHVVAHEHAERGMARDREESAADRHGRTVANDIQNVFKSRKTERREYALDDAVIAVVEVAQLPDEHHDDQPFGELFDESDTEDVLDERKLDGRISSKHRRDE